MLGKRGYFGWAFDDNPEQASSEVRYEVRGYGVRMKVFVTGKQKTFARTFSVNPQHLEQAIEQVRQRSR